MQQLKPFKGEQDMLAAFTAHQAQQILMSEFGYNEDESEVIDVTDKLDMMVYDEDGQPTGTLREYIEACNGVAQYLYGWE